MAIVRLQHIGVAVSDFAAAWDRFDRILGMRPRDFRDDQAQGMQHDARVLLGNDCWLHLVSNWNPDSRVYRFLEHRGEGLEHIALETDDIDSEVRQLRDQKVPLFQDKIFDANDGYEAFVYPADGIGFTVELIQPHQRSWSYPGHAEALAVSSKLGIRRAGAIAAVVGDVEEAARRFDKCFGLKAEGARVSLGENCTLLLENDTSHPPRDRGLDRLVLETVSFDEDVACLRASQVPLIGGCILDKRRGVGFPVELRRRT